MLRTGLWMVLLAACGGDKDDEHTGEHTGTTDTTGDEVFSSFTVEAGDIPGVMWARAETAEAGTVRIEYGLDDSLGTASPDGASGTTHERAVLGVKTGREYTFQAVLTDASGAERRSGLVTARVTASATAIPTFNVGQPLVADQACDTGGFLLVSYLGQNNTGVVILDRDGDVVWSVPFAGVGAPQLARVRPGVDGTSLVYTTADAARIDLVGEIVRQPLDGTAPTVTATDTSHHDFVQHADGSYAWLGYTFPEEYTCAGGNAWTGDPVATDTIMESADGASFAEAEEIFNVADDYPHPLDCSVDDENFLPGYFDVSHANSLAYRESDDAYFLMWRWQDAFVKVDRATGQTVWTFGGAHNEFTPAAGQDASQLFNHSHMSEIWDDGVFIFNNNDFGPDDPGPSIIQEYHLDEVNKTWEIVWQWESDQGFEALLGDVRRMPYADCDNVLVSLSGSGIVRELTREGEVAWGVGLALGAVTSRVHFLPDIYDVSTGIAP